MPPPPLIGYVASDRELEVTVAAGKADYIVFCNGDTYYAQEVFEAAQTHMRLGLDVSAVGRDLAETTVAPKMKCSPTRDSPAGAYAESPRLPTRRA